ncbi:MAG: 4-hydroxy-tetrahydrodipicolinate synthase [Candidatus Methanomethylophilaceae archaeon]|nr:4-hydroxy-tetrahydrodipicolinate synthase [Candidatus Methanomethylophilaceae archaeon]MDD3379093.1 4-hydroxy-tetrahydrodipicolinate synthase [Candidatus Methanomethylophilaceae archaeon]MDY0224524.1 4-hydroxy-tetrahydrodipicolinate synthase [Candidatus Methanomethylophilaceae archaeon]
MFKGTATALITPFQKDGSVDEDSLRRLVDFQEENGVKTVVPCGSTGESATLSHEEHIHVISIVIDQARKAKVLAGAGSNCTSEAVMLSKRAEDLGADGILSISPYYVKPTQEGIYQHFKAIAESVKIPLVVYNVPGRTGSNIDADTTLRLAEIDGINAIKEASGNLAQIEKIIRERPKGFEVLSGDDGLTYTLMCKGADGVISVTSNCIPAKVSQMVNCIINGEKKEAEALNNAIYPLFKAMFVESNPIPIKYVMQRLGYGNGSPRLPLTPISEEGKKKLDPILEQMGL